MGGGGSPKSIGTKPSYAIFHSLSFKQLFHVFGACFEEPLARLQTANNFLLHPSRYILSQHPHSHPSKWVAWGQRGRQNRQGSKNGSKVHKLHEHLSHSAPYKPHGVGTQKKIFGSTSKKNPKIHHFRLKHKGGHFLTPPPPTNHPRPPVPQAPKSGFQVEGVYGG